MSNNLKVTLLGNLVYYLQVVLIQTDLLGNAVEPPDVKCRGQELFKYPNYLINMCAYYSTADFFCVQII